MVDASVTLDIAHRRIGALKARCRGVPPRMRAAGGRAALGSAARLPPPLHLVRAGSSACPRRYVPPRPADASRPPTGHPSTLNHPTLPWSTLVYRST